MADVYDAFDERLQRPVALKVLRPEVAVDETMRRRFEGEARAAARLSHPSVVSVYDSGEHDGRAFLVMERLPGETLADRIKRGPVDPSWLRTVAFDVLAALGAAHAIGLIHRDVKPGNVLITEDGRAKVADFGIAKMTVAGDGTGGDLTAVGTVLGTPAYLAPERLAGRPATVASDLYAVGVVLYEAAAGHKPVPGSLDATVVGSGVAGAEIAEAAPGIDPALSRVIQRAMATRPGDRYPSAESMAADLRRGGGEVPPFAVEAPTTVLAAGVGAPTTVSPPRFVPVPEPDGRRILPVVVGLLALLIVIVLIILASNTGGSNGPSTTTVPATTAVTVAPTTTTTMPDTTTTTTTSSSSTTSTTLAPTTTTTVPATTTTMPATTTTTTAPTTTIPKATTTTKPLG